MSEPNTCECCGAIDGVNSLDGVEGVAVDAHTGLCLYCQPCPWCGRMGTDCSTHGPRGCDPQESPDGTPCPPLAERQTMRF